MKHQTDVKFCPWINDFGCMFLVMVYWFYFLLTNLDRGYDEIEGIRKEAFDKGIISGDLNHDGDLNDAGEGEIQGEMKIDGKDVDGKDALCDIAGVKLHYIGRVPVESYRWEPGHYCMGEFYHEWDDAKGHHKYRHFVAINGREVATRKSDKEIVTYDPIPNSNTVANGKLVAIRVFVKKGDA